MTPRGTQQPHKTRILRRARRVVVKVGSNVLTGPGGLRRERVRALARDLAAIIDAGRDVVLVTSGAVASGATKLGPRKARIEWRQAAAAVGQIHLMASYERAFGTHGRSVAQVLLTHADLVDRRRYLNARHTLRTLLGLGIVPIVNENDTVAVEELRFGDNDNLSALTASLIGADLLVILTDVAGLYDRDPRQHDDATLVAVAEPTDPRWAAAAGGSGSAIGTGGMASKLGAAQTAAAAGIPTILADGTRTRILQHVFDPSRDTGTLLLATGDALTWRKHWIAYTLKPAGTLTVDAGARDALIDGKRSLLPSGVRAVVGQFGVGDCVRCVGPDGQEFARGLTSYAAPDVVRLLGSHTREIEKRLGYKGSDEVIHRDDLVILTGALPA